MGTFGNDVPRSKLSEISEVLLSFAMLDEEQQGRVLNEFRRAVQEASAVRGGHGNTITQFLNGLYREIYITISDESAPLLQAVSESLVDQLVAHHATKTMPLERKSFEEAVEIAVDSIGQSVLKPASATQQRWDLVVNGERWALKTEGAKGIKEASVVVSKLTEARWIQQATDSRDLAERLSGYLEDYLDNVDRMFVLRCFQGSPAIVYELVEVPVSVLKPAVELGEPELERRLSTSKTLRYELPGYHYSPGEQDSTGSTTVSYPFRHPGGVPLNLGIRLDQSDGKVALSDIPLAVCVVHAVVALLPVRS